MSGPTNPGPAIATSTGSTTTPTPKQVTAAQNVRRGDTVYVTGWVDGDKELAGIVTRVIGTKINACVFTEPGGTTPAYMIPYDPSGKTPGSWRLRG